LQSQIRRVGDALYHIGKHPSSVIKGIKCALAFLGVCNDFMAEPFHRFRADELELVKMRLKQIQAEVSELDR
jgi:4-hydroxy-tetrahydrodipicolinate synthase